MSEKMDGTWPQGRWSGKAINVSIWIFLKGHWDSSPPQWASHIKLCEACWMDFLHKVVTQKLSLPFKWLSSQKIQLHQIGRMNLWNKKSLFCKNRRSLNKKSFQPFGLLSPCTVHCISALYITKPPLLPASVKGRSTYSTLESNFF